MLDNQLRLPTNYLLLVEITNRLSITSWDYQLIIYYYWLTATGYNRFIITFSVFLSNGLVDWCFFNTNFSNTPCPATLWPEQILYIKHLQDPKKYKILVYRTNGPQIKRNLKRIKPYIYRTMLSNYVSVYKLISLKISKLCRLPHL